MAGLLLPFTTTLWSVLLLAATPVMCQDVQCPIYREYNPVPPIIWQFKAPAGCECIDGMDDIMCSYCTSDEACKKVNADNMCRKDVVWGPDDTYKAFKCVLDGPLVNLFEGGKASFYVDLEKFTTTLAVFNTPTVNHVHAVNCEMTGCEFPIGGRGGYCNNTVCTCTDQCNSITKQLVEDSMSGKPVNVVVEEEEFGARLFVNIEGAPFPIEAVCNATACTLDPNPDFDETVIGVPTNYVWDERATFSLVVLSILGVVFIVLTFCVFVPEMMDQKPPATYNGELHAREESMETKQVLEFRNITSIVTLRKDAAKVHGQKEKKILDSVSGKVESGTLTAIMGPTGCGKSTLLNVIAAVGNVQARVSGTILLNGKQPGAGYRHQVAYVQQDDSLYDTLTVRECVEYSAMLRLPNNMKVEAKQAYVSKTLDELRLAHIAQNRIGSGGRNAGVSGGERKRVSIAMELVSQPSVLVLDEPTSGLDSFAANKIVSVLSELSSRNRIVMVSIHQPSMKCFMMFDQVMVLASGQVMYRGHPGEVNEYLEILGFHCPSMDTAADHLLQVVSDKNNFDTLKKSNVEAGNIEEQHASSKQVFYDEEEEKPLLNELRILFARTAKDIFRNKQLFLVQMVISIILAFFCGLIFRDVQNNLAGFQNRMGAFYFSLSFCAFASLSSMDIFVRERHIFVREAGSKYFRPFSYFLSKTVLDMFVLRVIPASIFSFIFYWMMGLRNSPEAFIKFWATLVLFNICAGVFSICIGIAAPTVGQANLIAAVCFLIMVLFGGFLLNVETMEIWYAWLKFFSIFYYAFEILMTNELSGLLLSFDAPGYPEIPVYGEIFLLTIGMDVDNQLRDLICLCCFALGCMVAAYMLLLLLVPQCAGRQFQSMETENKRIK